MKTKATAKFIGTSSRKLNLVAALVRGQKVNDLNRILMVNKRAATPIKKVLDSAIANATNNYGIKKSELVVESVFVGPGPTLKRFRPRAYGMAKSIRKRSSHITVVLSDESKVESKKSKVEKK